MSRDELEERVQALEARQQELQQALQALLEAAAAPRGPEDTHRELVARRRRRRGES